MRPTKKKPASKRQTCRQKYKIQRKVREHNRKVRKQEKISGKGSKLKKDPGIPNMHPFKESILRSAEQTKERIREAKIRQSQQRFDLVNQKRGLTELEELKANADKRNGAYDATMESEDEALGNYAQGPTETSRKAFYREFRKVVDAADVILQVLDARDPIGCRCTQVEQDVIAAGSNKKLVLVLNKIDLVPAEVAEAWLKHLRNEFPTIAFKASTQTQKSNLGQSKAAAIGTGGSEARGTGTLLKLLANYCRNLNIKTSIRVGVVGYPNVGKSSIINSLKRSRACGVGATPGFTKAMQEITLDKHIKLIDSPGIVLSKGQTDEDLILRNVVKLESLADPIAPVQAILRRCDNDQIMELYSVPRFSDAMEFLQLLAKRIGKLKKGGIPDAEAAARVVLQDWNGGKISYYTKPPKKMAEKSQISSSIVSSWADAFDMDALLAEEEENVLPLLRSAKPSKTFVAMDSSEAAAEAKEDRENEDERMNEEEEEEKEYFTTKQTPKTTKISKRPITQAPPVVDQDALLNPQLNKSKKKLRKQQKRRAKRTDNLLSAAMSGALSLGGGNNNTAEEQPSTVGMGTSNFIEFDEEL